jgi:hypothetical protein
LDGVSRFLGHNGQGLHLFRYSIKSIAGPVLDAKDRADFKGRYQLLGSS